MSDILVLLAGIGIGTYFADEIRGKVSVLDPNKEA